MRAALIDSGKVVNYVEVDSYGALGPYPVVDPKDSVIGATYDPETETFTNPPEDPPA